ncbi:MAG: hypothetical protein ACO3O5_08955 [Burkholderiaceae bacterium]
MARRYTRDNRGRFASVGATARGGRLRTAAGNKRETVQRDLTLRNSKAKAARRQFFDASTAHGKAILPTKYGGMGLRGTKQAEALGKRADKAFSDLKGIQSQIRQSARGQSTIRKPRRLKPQEGLATKAKTTKPASKPTTTRLGSRIDPAKIADRKAGAAIARATAAETKARRAALRSTDEWSSPQRQKLNKRLDDANRETASLIQTRRNIRAQYPVMVKNKPSRLRRAAGATISAKSVGASSRAARVERASANLARGENRRNYTGKNRSRTARIAKEALKFMKNPRRSVKNMSYGEGFRMPRSLRG